MTVWAARLGIIWSVELVSEELTLSCTVLSMLLIPMSARLAWPGTGTGLVILSRGAYLSSLIVSWVTILWLIPVLLFRLFLVLYVWLITSWLKMDSVVDLLLLLSRIVRVITSIIIVTLVKTDSLFPPNVPRLTQKSTIVKKWVSWIRMSVEPADQILSKEQFNPIVTILR